MGTRVYGYSDDTIIIKGEGNPVDDVSCFKMDVIITFDDGAVIRCGYPKRDKAVWFIDFVQYGSAHYVRHVCNDENARPYSDELWIDAHVTNVKGVAKR